MNSTAGQSAIAGVSLTWLVGQLVCSMLPGLRLDDATARLLHEGKIGAVGFLPRNMESPAQVRALCEAVRQAAGRPVLIAAAQEGRSVWHLPLPAMHWPSAMALGATGRPALTRQVARALGTEVR